MLLFREKVPASWLPKVMANLPAVLVDHAHLERKAATSALLPEHVRRLVIGCGMFSLARKLPLPRNS
jgi:tRNA-(ms[2]io[6]A)-hydroxylase